MEIDEEEMEELFMDTVVVDDFEFDFDFEFEAPQFYDFTQPESSPEDEEADCWFDTASSYPPSPFIIKLNWRYDINDKPVDIASVSCHSADGGSLTSVGIDSNNKMLFKNSDVDDDNGGLKLRDQMGQGVPKSKTKPPVKASLSRSSTLMKPTASYLAKHDRLQEFYSNQISRRCQMLSVKSDKSSQNSSVIENLATKRQKLEAGYLCKVSQLKHHALFLHKNPQKVDVHSEYARSKVTMPIEPYLETAHRAQRHRSKANAESGETAKSNAGTFKAHPLNRKILKAPPSSPPKKSSVKLTEFQVFHLRTSVRARQHARNKVGMVYDYDYISQFETKDPERLNSIDVPKKENCEVKSSKAQSLNKKILSSKGETGVFSNVKHETGVSLENNLPTDKRFLNEPPTEPFSKLSLASDVQANSKSQSKMPIATKGSKENAPALFHLEQEMIKAAKARSPRFCRNQYLCGSGRRITEVGSQFNNNRKLDIR